MDFWDQLLFLSRAIDGDVRFSDLWAQANEHRIVVGKLQFILEYAVFDGTYVFLFAVALVSCFLIALTVGLLVWLEARDALLGWGVTTTAAVAMVSPMSTANLINPIQIIVFQVYFFAVCAI